MTPPSDEDSSSLLRQRLVRHSNAVFPLPSPVPLAIHYSTPLTMLSIELASLDPDYCYFGEQAGRAQPQREIKKEAKERSEFQRLLLSKQLICKHKCTMPSE